MVTFIENLNSFATNKNTIFDNSLSASVVDAK